MTLIDGFYWTKLNDDSDWEPAKLEGDHWSLIGDSYETYPTERMAAIGPRVAYETSMAVAQADFLCRRLSEFEISTDPNDTARDFMGHVDPALSRLKHTLDITTEEGPVARKPLTDVRQLVYLQAMLVNCVIPIADAEPVDGDFTVTLKIKRKAGKSLVDANLTIPAKQTRR